MFDNLKDVVAWLGNVLAELVTGIRNTFLYWDHRKDDLEDLVEE